MNHIKRVRNGTPSSGEFDTNNRTESNVQLSEDILTFDTVDSLCGNSDAVDAMLIAAAGDHHMLLKVDGGAAAEAKGVVDALGRATGKHIVVVAPGTKSTELLGGPNKPGIFEKADGGILYVPDAQELSPAELDLLHIPLDLGAIHYSRGGEQHTAPSDFQLILGVATPPADLAPTEARHALSRLAGPLRERMGLTANVVPTDSSKPIQVTDDEAVTSTTAARARIAAELKDTPWTKMSHVSGSWLRGPLKRVRQNISAPIDLHLERGGITMRGYDRVLRIANTLAAIDGTDVTADHIRTGLEYQR
jgi:magnesium chelatase family protein